MFYTHLGSYTPASVEDSEAPPAPMNGWTYDNTAMRDDGKSNRWTSHLSSSRAKAVFQSCTALC
jgi:hypothetical protein